MKNKKFAKRLKFNKETIAHLNGKQMGVIKGKEGNDTCPGWCEWDVTVPVNCSDPGLSTPCTNGCQSLQTQCESIGQEWCGTMPQDTCC